ncbi:phosphoribosyltransferase family protein [Streptodolium elevatio]
MSGLVTAAAAEWSGTWVSQRLGIRLGSAAASIGPRISTDMLAADDGTGDLRALVGLALRRNPRRAHLLVSTVLGKHVPQLPHIVHDAGLALGAQVREVLGGDGVTPVVLGYAETATGLGHCVAEALPGATYLHSTRRPVEGVAPLGGFEEEHSHATSHLLLPQDRDLLSGPGPLVLVDDELSTGRTVLNTIEALHELAPRERYVIAALIDVRTPADRRTMAAFAERLGARVDVVSLATGVVDLPHDALTRGADLVAAEEAGQAGRAGQAEQTKQIGQAGEAGQEGQAANPVARETTRGSVERIALDWPEGLPDGGRHGFTADHQAALEKALPELGARLAGGLPGARRVLVLGCEELMYVPLRLARALADATAPAAGSAAPGSASSESASSGSASVGSASDSAASGSADGPAVPAGPPVPEVRYSTTTRSPVLAVDDPGYAIRTRLTFPSHDDPADGPGDRYTYNVDPGADPARRFDTIVLVVDSTADTPALHAEDGLLDVLAGVADRVALVVVPSYIPRQAADHEPGHQPSRVPGGVPGSVSSSSTGNVPDSEVAV